MRRDLRRLQDHGAVDVDHAQPALGEHRDDLFEQRDRVGAAPALVGVGEVVPDVAETRSAQQGVDHRVGQHVGVRVAVEPALERDLDPSEDQPAPLGEAVRVVSEADPHTVAPIGSRRRRRPSNTHSSLHAELVEQLERLLVAGADVGGAVRVARERERQAGFQAHLQERPRRVDLADGLAQPRGRHLHGHPGFGEGFDGGLVVEAQVAIGHALGVRVAPDLHEIGVGDDVEEAAAGALGDGLEVARPDPVGAQVRALRVPDAVVVHVDRAVADEVDGADDVVEVARLEQRRGAVLGARDEVGLDAEPQVGLLAHERAVLVDVIDGVAFPERVAPQLQRLAEAVDVFGDPQLGDALL